MNGKYKMDGKDLSLKIVDKTSILEIKQVIYDYFQNNSGYDENNYYIMIDSDLNKECNIFYIIQSLSTYIINSEKKENNVIIGYSKWQNAESLVDEIKQCFWKENIKVYIFEKACPYLELIYAMKKKSCVAGIYIEQDISVPTYIKYIICVNESGKQLQIYDFVKKYPSFISGKYEDYANFINEDLYQLVGFDIDKEYIEELKKMVLEKDSIKAMKELIDWTTYNEYIELYNFFKDKKLPKEK